MKYCFIALLVCFNLNTNSVPPYSLPTSAHMDDTPKRLSSSSSREKLPQPTMSCMPSGAQILQCLECLECCCKITAVLTAICLKHMFSKRSYPPAEDREDRYQLRKDRIDG